jgi:hypothetical protein
MGWGSVLLKLGNQIGEPFDIRLGKEMVLLLPVFPRRVIHAGRDFNFLLRAGFKNLDNGACFIDSMPMETCTYPV